jgi:hypothetical protein
MLNFEVKKIPTATVAGLAIIFAVGRGLGGIAGRTCEQKMTDSERIVIPSNLETTRLSIER